LGAIKPKYRHQRAQKGSAMWIWATAAAQDGVIAYSQLILAGISPSTIVDWKNEGRLRRVQPRVYAVAGAPWTFRARCFAALLAAGPDSALSHRTAAYLWGTYPDEPPIEIVVPRGQTPDLRGVVVHQTRDPFTMHHRNGLRVTSPMRAVLDLAAVESPFAVEHAIDLGTNLRLFTVLAIEWELVRLARRGRQGCGTLRRVLDQRALGRDRAEGLLEARFARLRVKAGLPAPVYQHPVGKYRIDFAYPELMIAIEVNDFWSHSIRKRFESDHERRIFLTALGWTVIEFTWNQIVRRSAWVAKVVVDAIGRAKAEIPA
jgi:very-short-patch-repair endonuclease